MIHDKLDMNPYCPQDEIYSLAVTLLTLLVGEENFANMFPIRPFKNGNLIPNIYGSSIDCSDG